MGDNLPIGDRQQVVMRVFAAAGLVFAHRAAVLHGVPSRPEWVWASGVWDALLIPSS